MRLATVLLTIGLSLGLSGCWFRKKTPVAPPPPAPQVKPAPPVKLPEQKPPEQKPLPMPPPTEIKEPAQIPLPAPQKTPPPRPAPRRRRTPPTPPPPPPAEQPPAQPPAPPPQLGEILPNAERRQYEADYAQSLSRARSALQQASGKSLNPTQKETVERIKTFLQQAEESKGKDLATALQLARRADVLGQDLLKDFP
jgi:type IV secretory pathway VirB10-like protein